MAGLQYPRRLWLLVHEPPPYEEPSPYGRPWVYSNAKMRFQSFFMLITVQPFCFASS
jgi:hypothetical protein